MILFSILLFCEVTYFSSTGNFLCWSDSMTFDFCCNPLDGVGNIQCWDFMFNYQTCCVFNRRNSDPSAYRCNLRLKTNSTDVPVKNVNFINSVINYVNTGRLTHALLRTSTYMKKHWHLACIDAIVVNFAIQLEQSFIMEEVKWKYILYKIDFFLGKRNSHLNYSEDINFTYLFNKLLRKAIYLRNVYLTNRSDPSKIRTVNIVLSICGSEKEYNEVVASYYNDFCREPDRLMELRRSTKIVLVSKCHDRPAFAARVTKTANFFREKLGLKSEILVVNDWHGLSATETSANFAYLAQFYTNPSDWSFFVHPDIFEHMSSVDTFVMTVHLASIGFLNEVSPNLHFFDMGFNYNRIVTYLQPHFVKRYLKEFFNLQTDKLAPDTFSMYCCAHFALSKTAWHYRKHEFFIELDKKIRSPLLIQAVNFPFTNSTIQGINSESARSLGHIMEPVWHILFGEDVRIIERSDDPRIPLYIKMSNLDRFWI